MKNSKHFNNLISIKVVKKFINQNINFFKLNYLINFINLLIIF